MNIQPSSFVCGYVIEFEDGGPDETQVLQVGTRDECESIANLLPAISYSGSRPLKKAYMMVSQVPKEPRP